MPLLHKKRRFVDKIVLKVRINHRLTFLFPYLRAPHVTDRVFRAQMYILQILLFVSIFRLRALLHYVISYLQQRQFQYLLPLLRLLILREKSRQFDLRLLFLAENRLRVFARGRWVR